MRKNFIYSLLINFFFALPALAQTTDANRQTSMFLSASGIGVTSIAGITGTIITTLLGLLGVIFVVLMIYAGFQWMMAEGNEEKVEKAKNTIARAIIGLAIVIAASAITYFVFNALNTATGSGSSGGPSIST